MSTTQRPSRYATRSRAALAGDVGNRTEHTEPQPSQQGTTGVSDGTTSKYFSSQPSKKGRGSNPSRATKRPKLEIALEPDDAGQPSSPPTGVSEAQQSLPAIPKQAALNHDVMADVGPANWTKILENIRYMRRNRDAPVDSMGCEVLADKTAPVQVQKFHVLVALMLSSQTKDEITSAAVKNLQRSLPGGLTIESIRLAAEDTIKELIRPVGFYQRKASYLKRAAEDIATKFNGHVPDTIEDLVSLPGVGMKMATIAMSAAHGIVSGIGVDVHVHRIANRLKWADTTDKTPEHTRVALEQWMPRELWGEINLLLVGFGQTICQPRNPKCHECLNASICPSASLAKAKSPKNSPAKRSKATSKRAGENSKTA